MVTPLIQDDIGLKCDHGLISEIYESENEVGYGINFAPAFKKYHKKRKDGVPVRRPNCPQHYNETPPEWDRNLCLRDKSDENQTAL